LRRDNDFYPTPAWATQELLRKIPQIGGYILEPCVGDGAIARVIDGGNRVVYGSDIDPQMNCSFCGDATRRDFWENVRDVMFEERLDWAITNPPFNVAAQIVPLAYEFASVGIAMLLRLSFLEPVEDRGAWLNEHPPTGMIVLPRISFTGDGKTDSVTCAWMVWEKSKTGTIAVAENPKFIKRENVDSLFATA
jgi:hypothetical protein